MCIFTAVFASGLLSIGACAHDDGIQGDRTMREAREADRRLAACLAQAGHGYSLENADIRRLGDPQFNESVETCATQLGIEIPAAGDNIRAMARHVRNVVDCLRAKGWDIPEPVHGPHGSLKTDNLATRVPEDRQDEFFTDYQDCGNHVSAG